MTAPPILDWRRRCVGGERAGDLWDALCALDASCADEAYDLMLDEHDTALPLHRALLRLVAEALVRRADRLEPWMVDWPESWELTGPAFDELLLRLHDAMCAGAASAPREAAR